MSSKLQELTTPILNQFYEKYKSSFISSSKIHLMKKIFDVSSEILKKEPFFKPHREILGKDKVDDVIKATTQQNLSCVEDYSKDYYKLINISFMREEITRSFLEKAFESNKGSGFDEFDLEMIKGMIKISRKYEKYFIKWNLLWENSNKTSQFLRKLVKENKHKDLSKDFLNHYTIIQIKQNEKNKTLDKLTTEDLCIIPYSIFFKDEYSQIIKEMKKMIENFELILKKLEKNNENEKKTEKMISIQQYINYFNQMIICYQETKIDKLEQQWKKLDEIWVEIKYWIQIVHEIEYGYSDPLRTKIIPDLSLRLSDLDFKEEGDMINNIVHPSIVEYFQTSPKRKNTDLTKKSIKSLKNSMSCLFFVPFFSGDCICFRLIGQSIPNDVDVKSKKGVKIYSDPNAMNMKLQFIHKLSKTVLGDVNYKEYSKCLTLKHMLFDTTAHEFGHCIYNLEEIKDCIKVTTRTLLEEPRADLTTTFMIKYCYDKQLFNKEKMFRMLVNVALNDLRRFEVYESPVLKGYVLSAKSKYNIFEETGFVKIEKDSKSNQEFMTFDKNKAECALNKLAELFEKVLLLEEQRNGEKLEEIMENMKKEGEIIKWLLKKIYKKQK